MNRKSWYTLWPLLLLLVSAFVSGSRAATEREVAARQQTTTATLLECRSHKGGNNCSYLFEVEGAHYVSRDSADSSDVDGQVVMVYFDPENPKTSGLKDFSAKAQFDWFLVAGLLLASVFLVVLYFKGVGPRDSSQQSA